MEFIIPTTYLARIEDLRSQDMTPSDRAALPEWQEKTLSGPNPKIAAAAADTIITVETGKTRYDRNLTRDGAWSSIGGLGAGALTITIATAARLIKTARMDGRRFF